MANFDLSKSLRSVAAGAEKLLAYSAEAITGKSSFGRVARLKFERPACTASRPEAASSDSVTRAPSGSLRTISWSMTAETVVAPARSTCAVAMSTISISRSVARNCTRSPSASIRTLARIGMVLRRSTTDCACATALSSVPRSMLNFMPSLLSDAGLAPGGARYRNPPPAQAFCDVVSRIGHCVKGRGPPVVSGFERAAQQFEVVGDLGILLAQLVDLLDPVHHGGVVAPAEASPDLGQGAAGELFAQVHGHLPGTRIAARAPWPDEIGQADVVMVGHLALDLLDRELALVAAQHVREAILRQVLRNGLAHQRGEGAEPRQGTLEHAHVGVDPVGEEFEHAVLDLEIGLALAVAFGAVLQHAEAQLVIGGMEIDDEAALQPRLDPVLEPRDLSGCAIGGDDDLLVLVHQRVEGVKEFLLRAVLAGDELHVIDHQHVDRAEHLLEIHDLAVAQRLHEAIHELLGREVKHGHVGAKLDQVPGDGVHQVRFAQPHATVKEQRVEGGLAALGDAARGCMGKLIGLADHETVEAEPFVERRGMQRRVGARGARLRRILCLARRLCAVGCDAEIELAHPGIDL